MRAAVNGSTPNPGLMQDRAPTDLRRKIVFMFSGQGSQYYQMGRDLYRSSAVFREWMHKLDAVVSHRVGRSVIREIYRPDRGEVDEFDDIYLSSSAIVMVEYALARHLMDLGVRPSLTLGVSLGTFSAASVSGMLDIFDALSAVLKMAEITAANCAPGAMIAVVDSAGAISDRTMGGCCEVAALNLASHFVLSVQKSRLAEIEAFLHRRDVPYQILPVKFAFHSKWIDGAEASYKAVLQDLKLRTATIPMACAMRGTIVSNLSRDHLWDVARQPIRFPQVMNIVERSGPCLYVDTGPSGTLATLLKYILPQGSRSLSKTTLRPFAGDEFDPTFDGLAGQVAT
jgi:acyl transferase domain-containing protein